MMSRQEFLQDVAFLAEKYGFDAAEADRFLNLADLKLVRKRGPAAKPKPKTEKSVETKPKTKRALTGYLLFSKEMREEAKAELTRDLAEGEKLQPKTVVTKLAALWKALGPEDRALWNTRAKSEAGDETSPKPLTRAIPLADLEVEGAPHAAPASLGSVVSVED